MKQFHRFGKKVLWTCTAAALLAGLTLSVGDTFARYRYASSIDYVLFPQEEWSLPVQSLGDKDYLQEGGQEVWLAPWELPEYGTAGTLSKTYTFSMAVLNSNDLSATGNSYVTPSATLSGKQITLNLTLTDAAKQLVTPQKTKVRVTCGSAWADVSFWILPMGATIPKDGDSLPVELNPICKQKTDNVYTKTGQAALTLSGTDRNSYQLTFLHNGAAIEGLRYSLDGGNTYIQLHDWNQLNLPLQNSASTVVLLDYSKCGIDANSRLQVQICRQNDTQKVQTILFEVSSDDPGQKLNSEPRLLSQQQALQLPVAWNGCTYEYQLLQLVNGQKQAISLPAGMSATKAASILSFSILPEEGEPKAGTYFLRIQWKLQDVVCEQAEIPVFINYSLM